MVVEERIARNIRLVETNVLRCSSKPAFIKEHRQMELFSTKVSKRNLYTKMSNTRKNSMFLKKANYVHSKRNLFCSIH